MVDIKISLQNPTAGEKKDLLLDIPINFPGSEEAWSNYKTRAFEAIFEKQYERATSKELSPLHNIIAEEFGLRQHCLQENLIPVFVDRFLPNNVTSMVQALTSMTNDLYTTTWVDDGGPLVRKANLTAKELRDEILNNGKIVTEEKRNVSDADEKDLKDALKQELDSLALEADDDSAPQVMWGKFIKRRAELEEKMRDCPCDAQGQFMEMRAIEMGNTQRLLAAMRAKQMLDLGKNSLFEKVRKYKSPTEILWWDLQMGLGSTYCDILDTSTIEETFTFVELTTEKAAGNAHIYSAPSSLTAAIKAFNEEVVPEKVGLQSEIDQKKQQIANLEKEEKDEEDKKGLGQEVVEYFSGTPKDVEIANKKKILEEQILNLQALHNEMSRVQQEVTKNSRERVAMSVKVAEESKCLAAQLDKAAEDFEKLANSSETNLKAVWKTQKPSRPGTAFETRIRTTFDGLTDTKQETHVTDTKVEGAVGTEVEGGEGPLTAIAGQEENAGLETEKGKGSGEMGSFLKRMHFEAEGAYGKLNNPLLAKSIECLNNENWYAEDKNPGYLWTPPPHGKNVRYVVEEMFFCRKLCWWSSDDNTIGTIQAQEDKVTEAAGFETKAGGGVEGLGRATEYVKGNVSHAHQNLGRGLNAYKKAQDDTVHSPNLCVKFLLLKPVMPGPKQKDDKKEKNWELPDYAHQYLGGKEPQA